ncbi:MAG TPA: NB-ARC domain-containing protein [Ktedonobacteraceae bacterium]
MQHFTELIEEHRKAKQMSRKKLAIQAKLSPGYISLLISGKRSTPSEKTIEALADALHLDGKDRTHFFEAAKLSYKFSQAPSNLTSPNSSLGQMSGKKEGVTKIDWGEAPNLKSFYGRQKELTEVEQWIVHDHCSMVAVVGIGGIGKTTLTGKLVERVQDAFEYVFWRSLQNAPSVENVLKECLQFFSGQKGKDLPEDMDVQIAQVITFLREHRCLIVLDNFESVLQESQSTGQYRKGYSGYGRLLQSLGEVRHQSSLLLTSREKPKEVARLEGSTLPIRSMLLLGQGVGQKVALPI